MRITLAEIKGMERRVRKSQSPEKLEELTDSLKETGQVVPIKVRKNGDGYTLIYGHRRVAAAKMAGMKDIEAVVEDVPEDRLLTQALVENVVREDMAAIDIAKALRTILDETGCTQGALASKMGWTQGTVAHHLDMLTPELGLERSNKYASMHIGHVEQAKAGTNNLQDAAKVLKYAAEHGDEEGVALSPAKTRQVAEVVRKAAEFGGEAAVRKVLAQPAAQIIASAPVIAPHHVKPKVREVEGRIAFQWTTNPKAILAEEGMNIARNLFIEIVHDERDRGGGKAAIRRIVALAKLVVKEGEKSLERM
ncbi:MAG: ParB/RepB/Spo0J family partition protein [Candidatus Rokuibacteriota bacterium]